MVKTFPLGEAVATRRLEFIHQDGRKEAVQVSIGRPVCVDQAQGEWSCPYLIKAHSFQKQRYSVGGDSMQALILSLQTISANLVALARDHKGSFTYLGDGDLHFPGPR
jgi:hypothetical protein